MTIRNLLMLALVVAGLKPGATSVQLPEPAATSLEASMSVAPAFRPASAQTPADRTAPPKVGPTPTLKVPPIQVRALSNGLRVWVAEMHEVPVVQIALVCLAGAGADPAGKFGLASLTAAMLDEGAGSRSALEIADAIEYLGASLGTGSSFDASSVSLWVPVARIKEALPIFADVVLRPTFSERELERLRKERLTSMLQARDDPASISAEAFARIVYGSTHRYGIPDFGSPDAVRSLTAADVRAFYQRHFQPANAVVIVAGDLSTESAVKAIEQAFGSWKMGGGSLATPASMGDAPAGRERQVYLIDKPGAAQSNIRIGWVGVARSTPDYFPLLVMNTVLGGSFTSRLNSNLREEHGYAYGASSAFVMRRLAGPFVASAGVQTDKTSESLGEFFKELNGILEDMPPDELAKAKNYVALGLPAEFETVADVARKIQEMVVYDLPRDYFNNYVQNVQAVTTAEVRRVAARYIQPDRFAVVVVGDRKAIEPGIRARNLGPIKVMTVEEALGPMPGPTP